MRLRAGELHAHGAPLLMRFTSIRWLAIAVPLSCATAAAQTAPPPAGQAPASTALPAAAPVAGTPPAAAPADANAVPAPPAESGDAIAASPEVVEEARKHFRQGVAYAEA